MKIKCLSIIIVIATLLFSGCGNTDNSANPDADNAFFGGNSFASDYQPGEENYYGATPTNMANFSYVAFQGDWVYFTTGFGIAKMKSDGSEKTEVIGIDDNIGGISYIQIVGDWIYFSGESGDYYKFFKVKTDGTELISILDGYYVAWVVGDTLYFVEYENVDKNTKTGKIVSLRTDGADEKVLFVAKDYFYSIENEISIYKVDESGIIFSEMSPINGGLHGDTSGPDAFWHVNLDGSDPKRLTEYRTVKYSNGEEGITSRYNHAKLIGDDVIYRAREDDGLYISALNIITLKDTKLTPIDGFTQDDFVINNIMGDKYIGEYRNQLVAHSKDLELYYEINTDAAPCVFINEKDLDWIYYSDFDNLYRVHIDGTGWEQLGI